MAATAAAVGCSVSSGRDAAALPIPPETYSFMSMSTNQTENNSCTLNNARVEAENVSCHNCRPQLLATCVGLPTYLPTWECWGGKAEPLSGTGRIDDLRLPPWYRPRPLPPLNVSDVLGERTQNMRKHISAQFRLACCPLAMAWPGQRERESLPEALLGRGSGGEVI